MVKLLIRAYLGTFLNLYHNTHSYLVINSVCKHKALLVYGGNVDCLPDAVLDNF